MQNLPITITAATPPAIPAHAAVSMDHNAAPQTTEPFGKILARQQRANAQDGQQAQAAHANPATDGAADADQGTVPDLSNTLPGDMLAALLPTCTNPVKGKVADERKPAHKVTQKTEAITDGAAVSPNAMPIAALSPIVTQGKDGAPQQSLASSADGNAQRPADHMLTLGKPGKAATFASHAGAQAAVAARTPGEILPSATHHDETSSARPDAFSSMLGALDKDTANMAVPATQIATQIVAHEALPDAATLTNLAQGIAAMTAPVSQNAPMQVAINTPLTQDKWGDEFNQKITWLATQNEQTAELHLNPPQLGPLDVVINVSGDRATALFTSPHAAVRDAVEQALPKLRDMLADNGITLGNATVSDQSSREQQQAWQMQQQKEGGGNSSARGSDIAIPGGIQTSSTPSTPRRQLGMLDTFA
ncbi:MAG: flagellar hook-length control protein FliK [Nitrosomonadales bacterium]|nr:flagellar hook-length control protein FliK [Nitrosomonadales bacterium]